MTNSLSNRRVVKSTVILALFITILAAIAALFPATTHAATITSNNLTTQKSTVQGKRIYLSLQLTSYGTYWNPDVYGWQIKGPNGYNQTFPIYRTVYKNQTLTDFVDVPHDGTYTIQAFVKAYNSTNYSYDTIWSYNGDSVTVVTVPQNSGSGTPLFPLKGSISRSSSATTNGFYCDYTTNGNVPVYAPANGTAVFKQAYTTMYMSNGSVNLLTSYGNWIEFTSSDGQYVIKLAHLNSFNGISLNIPSSQTSKQSGSTGGYTLATRNVSRGDLLGYSGVTGNSSGHHLHIEVRQWGKAINPATLQGW